MIFADQSDIKPVDLPELTPEPFAQTIVQTLAQSEFDDVLLFGGALRDHFRGATDVINDYDICATFGTSAGSARIYKRDADWFAQKILALFPGARLCEEPFLQHTTSRSQSWGRVRFVWQDKTIDLLLSTIKMDLGQRALMADAPINAVAMDAAGRVCAHPSFSQHVRNRVYDPLPFIEATVAQERFNHLREKISGLHRPAARPPGPPAPQP